MYKIITDFQLLPDAQSNTSLIPARMEFDQQAREYAEMYEREAAAELEREQGEDDGEDEELIDRMEVFMPVVQTLVGALGGFEVSEIR